MENWIDMLEYAKIVEGDTQKELIQLQRAGSSEQGQCLALVFVIKHQTPDTHFLADTIGLLLSFAYNKPTERQCMSGLRGEDESQ